MATMTLRPNADGDETAWVASGAANDWDCVDESSSDDDTTYIGVAAATAGDVDELLNLPASGLSGGDTINSVALTLRCRSPLTPPDCKFLWKENGVKSAGATFTLTTSFVDYTETKTTRPSDGAAWMVADVDALQVGIRRVGDVSKGSSRCTQVFAVVDYTTGANKRCLTLVGVGS